MKNDLLMKERKNLQNLMLETFHKEVQVLDPELQSMFIDDLVSAFYNRLAFMKKIQASH
jgi:hypothetical protein